MSLVPAEVVVPLRLSCDVCVWPLLHLSSGFGAILVTDLGSSSLFFLFGFGSEFVVEDVFSALRFLFGFGVVFVVGFP